jgi:hypothetical protein
MTATEALKDGAMNRRHQIREVRRWQWFSGLEGMAANDWPGMLRKSYRLRRNAAWRAAKRWRRERR